jgi:hypothetical protein
MVMRIVITFFLSKVSDLCDEELEASDGNSLSITKVYEVVFCGRLLDTSGSLDPNFGDENFYFEAQR